MIKAGAPSQNNALERVATAAAHGCALHHTPRQYLSYLNKIDYGRASTTKHASYPLLYPIKSSALPPVHQSGLNNSALTPMTAPHLSCGLNHGHRPSLLRQTQKLCPLSDFEHEASREIGVHASLLCLSMRLVCRGGGAWFSSRAIEGDQAKELRPRPGVRLEATVYAAGHRHRPLLLHASHHHAHVAGARSNVVSRCMYVGARAERRRNHTIQRGKGA